MRRTQQAVFAVSPSLKLAPGTAEVGEPGFADGKSLSGPRVIHARRWIFS
jgi:hypothetical protein